MTVSEWIGVIGGMTFVWYIFPIMGVSLAKRKVPFRRHYQKPLYELDFCFKSWTVSRRTLLFLMFCPIVNIVVGFGWLIIMAFILSLIGPAILIGIMEFINFLRGKD